MNTDIHRLLDEAFAGVEMTPDAQDLKEEVRANLVARVDELEASGRSSSDAARQAIAELGDVRELLDGAGRRPTDARGRLLRRDAAAPPRAPQGRIRRAGGRVVAGLHRGDDARDSRSDRRAAAARSGRSSG